MPRFVPVKTENKKTKTGRLRRECSLKKIVLYINGAKQVKEGGRLSRTPEQPDDAQDQQQHLRCLRPRRSLRMRRARRWQGQYRRRVVAGARPGAGVGAWLGLGLGLGRRRADGGVAELALRARPACAKTKTILWFQSFLHDVWPEPVLARVCLGKSLSWQKPVLAKACLGKSLSWPEPVLARACLGKSLS
jgi:hypothetical protein